MANKDHVSVLNQGVDIWNQWRIDNQEIRPDLSEVDLSGLDFAGADFSKVDLSRVNLSRANLSQAMLCGAILGRANLSEANLSEALLNSAFLFEADLSGVDIRRADLSKAFLSRANLIAADLSGTDIRGADFSEALVGWTTLIDVNLGQAKGLKLVHHKGPSIIGMETIYRSGTKIPEQFLVGAGVPDQFIDYIETLAGEPFGYHSAIIGYSIKDEEFANKLYTSLQSENVRAWHAPIELTTGKKFRQRMDESIRLHVKLLLVLSEHSITNDWVAHLANTALANENEQVDAVLFPLRLDDALMEIETEGWQAAVKDAYHVIDFSRWKDPDTYQVAFDWLLRDLRAEVEDLESSLFYPES